ncbi:CaiB/BaiF CoA transferase family protein [Flavivirga eckloniae]|uniref:Carnitine dehydratase n=1 Tax=Flavivirga eckloniae TaxID=1803846 RepID=A0A2K9PSP7_9FLAO|nr:CoA transferase [Flavivirga eckloniae]AUP80069.1 carnitine dehydratase [Flavivirga eckloniae]
MKQALEGVKVLDFTQLLQGPYATQMLGDLGADVIKVERHGSGDIYRGMTFFNKWVAEDESPCFMAWNRNKRSISVDVKSEEGKKILYKLVETADVVMENFRPGVMERLGFGYETLKAINPKIIYCSASGWGDDGPYLTRPGQDLLVQSVSGAVMTSGKSTDGPVALGTALCDQVNALNSVYAILAALFYRERTGIGQEIKSNLLSSAIAFQMQDFFTIQNLGQTFTRPNSGIGHPGNGAPFGTYETSDGYITIAMSPWHKMVTALGDESLEVYNDPQTLYDKRDEIYYKIEAITKTKTTDEWLEIMLGLDLWVSKVNNQEDVEQDPQVIHNKTFVDIEHPKAGNVKVTNIPFTMSETPGKISRPSPMLGEHGPEILQEIGYSQDEINALESNNIITVERLNK